MAITAQWNNTNRVYSSDFIGQILKPLIIAASSDQTAQPKFKYQIRVNVGATEVLRMLYPVNQSNDALVDIATVIASECSPELRDNATPLYRLPFSGDVLFQPNFGDAVKWVSVQIFEYYAASATTTPSPELSATVQGLFIWSHNEFVSFDGIDPVTFKPNTTTSRFLTDQPTRTTIALNEDLTFAYFNDSNQINSPNASTQIRFEYSNGTVQSVTNTSFVPTVPTNANRGNYVLHVGAGTGNIERTTSHSIPAGVTWMKVYMDDGAGNKLSQVYHFDIVEYCDESFRLMFVNRYGFWDYFTFDKGYKNNARVTRTEFKKTYGNYNGTSYSYNQNERGIENNVEAERNYTLNSRYLTEEESIWLEQLITSPSVYWIDGSVMKPIIITDTNYENKSSRYDGNFNLIVNFKLSHEIRTQW